VRLRAQERATLELGPESDLELREKLRAEIAADRFTRIDRAITEEARDKADVQAGGGRKLCQRHARRRDQSRQREVRHD
jgi:hypothetical protein